MSEQPVQPMSERELKQYELRVRETEALTQMNPLAMMTLLVKGFVEKMDSTMLLIMAIVLIIGVVGLMSSACNLLSRMLV